MNNCKGKEDGASLQVNRYENMHLHENYKVVPSVEEKVNCWKNGDMHLHETYQVGQKYFNAVRLICTDKDVVTNHRSFALL